MDAFVFMPSIFVQKLTGEFITDKTMLGTSMLGDLKTRSASKEILQTIGIENKFPNLVEAGSIVGRIQSKAAIETGLPENLSVLSAGHDTQFALFGSGANENQPVLSSGTWEVLMVRTKEVSTDKDAMENRITNEMDAVPGFDGSF